MGRDFSEQVVKRIEEHYSVKRKIDYTNEEIKASAPRRRQRVLDYISKIGEKGSTVFIFPKA